MTRHTLSPTRKGYWEDNYSYVHELGNNAAFARQVELFSSQNVTSLPPRATEGRKIPVRLAAIGIAARAPQLTEEEMSAAPVRTPIPAQQDDALDISFGYEPEPQVPESEADYLFIKTGSGNPILMKRFDSPYVH